MLAFGHLDIKEQKEEMRRIKSGEMLLLSLLRAPELMMCELFPLVDVPPTSRCVRIVKQ